MQREIIAILRGITTKEAPAIAEVLIEAGIDKIEIPLNSPSPFESIESLINTFGDVAVIGAGTVLQVEQVKHLAVINASLVVSPDCNPDVIMATKRAKMLSYPGCFTATECFTALRHGADGLKLFPSFLVGPKGLEALRAVLPKTAPIYAVGGVGPDNFADWVGAGATGFGIGSSLYKPGMSLADIRAKVQDITAAYDAVFDR
jgi:2-dehydro-3-deoxyphosphogalactonate aldolase